MANKNSLSSILGVAAATVIAAGGSAYVTDAGLQMLDKQSAITQETNLASAERETEQPVKVEKFTATKDSFTVKPVTETENKKDSDKKGTEKKEQSTDKTEKAEGTTEGGSSSKADDSGIVIEGGKKEADGSSSSSKSGTQPVSYDEWGGWMAANGDYYDGQGGYWDGDGYHYVGDSIKTPEGAANYKPSSGSSGSSSSDSSSSGNNYDSGWDDSYILYDTAVRYMSEDELDDWGPWELAAARNEIFARHGRVFVTPEWSGYFAEKSWYTPKYDNVDDMLSDCEWANLNMIMKLEEKFY